MSADAVKTTASVDPPVRSPSRTPHRAVRRTAALTPVLVPMLTMLVVGLWGLRRGSLWIDEAVTFDVSQRGLPQLWALSRHVDLVHSAYYALMHVWMLPGGGEVWLRLPSVLAATASAGLLAAIASRVAGPRAGLVTGLLFTTIPFVSHHAQEARSYALVTCAVLTGTYCLVRGLTASSAGSSAGSSVGSTRLSRWWVGYAAAIVAAQTLHELACLALVAHGATVLLSRVERRDRLRWLVAALVCGVVLTPLAVASHAQAAQVGWLTRPTWATVTGLGGALFGSSTPGVVVLTGLVLVGLTVRPSVRPAAGSQVGIVAIAAPLLLLPPALLLLASLVQPLFMDRYVLYSAAAVPLLAGAGLDRLADRLVDRPVDRLADRLVDRPADRPAERLVDRPAGRVGRTVVRRLVPRAGSIAAVATVALLLVVQLPTLHADRGRDSRHDDLAAAAHVVATQARPGDAVLFLTGVYRAAERAYPDAFAGLPDVTLAGDPVATSSLYGTARAPAAAEAAMLAAPRIWVLGRPGLAIRRGFASRATRHFLRQHFRLLHTDHVHGVDVALYFRRVEVTARSGLGHRHHAVS